MLVKNFDKQLKFESVFERNLRLGKGNVDVCVGFCGYDVLKKYRGDLLNAAKNGRRIRLILGMYSLSGSFPPKLHAELMNLQQEFDETNRLLGKELHSNVFISIRPYHGKIYDFSEEVWLGSSNFSRTGFRDQLEAVVLVGEEDTISSIRSYVETVIENSVNVRDVVITSYSPTGLTLKSLHAYRALPSNLVSDDVQFELPLRVDEQPESGLNLSRGKGRLAKGKYTPRPWYEVEISSNAETRSQEGYPNISNSTPQRSNQKEINKCVFRALLFDGKNYRECQLQSYSAHNKAIGSDPRNVLGEFLKGQLEKAGLLRRPQAITSDILEEYGRTSIEVTRYTDTTKPVSSNLSNKVFVFDFSRP